MKEPLTVYVLWHPDFENGETLANQLYAELTKDVHQPLKHQLGIPVYFRCEAFDNHMPKTIDLDGAERVSIIVFIDNHFKLDQNYKDYLSGIIREIDGTSQVIYPVAISEHVFDITDGLKEINFIRYYEFEEGLQWEALRFKITHEIARLLFNRTRVAQAKKDNRKAPVKVFLSHAKDRKKTDGGESVAKQLRNFMQNEVGLDTFFDVLDIPAGSYFTEEIEQSIQESTFVAIHSDRYSTREWCRKEVTLAKEYQRPFIVINTFKKGEERSFPYLNNTPNYHWDLISVDEIEVYMYNFVYQIIREALRHKYNQTYLYYLSEVNDWENILAIFPNAPELYTLLYMDKNPTYEPSGNIIVYPDPPLGTEELRVLQKFNADWDFLTPNQFIPL